MTGLDCNILVQLAFADHAANAKTLAAVQAETVQGRKLVNQVPHFDRPRKSLLRK